jgi:hypothetical protein
MHRPIHCFCPELGVGKLLEKVFWCPFSVDRPLLDGLGEDERFVYPCRGVFFVGEV